MAIAKSAIEGSGRSLMFSAAYYTGRNNEDHQEMPGGIGPVSKTTASACGRVDREITSARNTNEIFYNLDSHRVFYDTADGFLYFVDSPGGIVRQTISASLQGMNSRTAIEQIYLDPHKYFNGANRVRMAGREADTLLIALRLAGVRTTVR